MDYLDSLVPRSQLGFLVVDKLCDVRLDANIMRQLAFGVVHRRHAQVIDKVVAIPAVVCDRHLAGLPAGDSISQLLHLLILSALPLDDSSDSEGMKANRNAIQNAGFRLKY